MIKEQAEELRAALDELIAAPELLDRIQEVCEMVVGTLRDGGKILTCGNGGSATDASHLAEELVGRYRKNRQPLAGISLTADSSALTCIANDFGFEDVFSRQVQALARHGDMLIGFTTSGKSPNINKALKTATLAGIKTAVLTGANGGEAVNLAQVVLRVPSQNSARIQEMHTLVLHMICEACEREFAR